MEKIGSRLLQRLPREIPGKYLKLPVIFMAMAAFFLGTAHVAKAAALICVDPSDHACYATIQAAVNAAPDGSSIDVAGGTYAEQVTISGKSLFLMGENATINAAGKSHGIFVTGASAAGTEISGFTVRNAQLEGILLENTSDISVYGNTVQYNDQHLTAQATCPGYFPFLQDDCGEGLHLMGASNSSITNNVVTGNAGGILLSDDLGQPTSDNFIAFNNVNNNKLDCGITLAAHDPSPSAGVYDNQIYDNTSTSNGGAGVGMFTPIPGTATYDNVVSYNTVSYNGLGGIDLHSHAPGQNLNGNTILANTISHNAPDFGSGPNAPTGIVVFADASHGAAPIVGTTITLNTVSGESVDVFIGFAQIDQTVELNNLLGGKGVVGIQNAGTGSVSAIENYWGCTAGPGKSSCTSVSGSVSFTPWLTSLVP